jgi:hypothetical protein
LSQDASAVEVAQRIDLDTGGVETELVGEVVGVLKPDFLEITLPSLQFGLGF